MYVCENVEMVLEWNGCSVLHQDVPSQMNAWLTGFRPAYLGHFLITWHIIWDQFLVYVHNIQEVTWAWNYSQYAYLHI